jgi:hypothetical protein
MEDLHWAFQELLFHDDVDDDEEDSDDMDDIEDEDDDSNADDTTIPPHHDHQLPPPHDHPLVETTTSTASTATTTRMPSMRTLERWAIFLYTAHSDNPRGFHSISRIFETTAGATPIQWLSACFRDCILINIDGDDDDDDEDDDHDHEQEPPSQRRPPLRDVFVVNEDDSNNTSSSSKYILNATTLEQEPNVAMVAAIFGFCPGQDLQDYAGRHQGLDAFLSAICAARLLRPVLSPTHLAQIAVCLEAHIPFRNMNLLTTATTTTSTNDNRKQQNDSTHQVPNHTTIHNNSSSLHPDLKKQSNCHSSPVLERLYQRLVQVNQDFHLHMSQQDMIRSVQQGADFANRGLGNLASDDPQVFLQHMWSLLPEHYEPLRRQFLYTLLDLHTAVQEMRLFFAALLPQLHQGYSLFSSFRGIPDAREMNHFHQQVQYNVAIGYEYLLAQCVSLRIVAALARLTGGAHVPMSFFYGDQPHNQPRDDEPKMIRLGETLFVTEFGEQPPLLQQHQEECDDDDHDDNEDCQQQQQEIKQETEISHDRHPHLHGTNTKVERQGQDEGTVPDVATGAEVDGGSPTKNHNLDHHCRHLDETICEPESIRATVLCILQDDCWGTHVYNFLDPRNAYLAAFLYKKLNHTEMEHIASQPLDEDDTRGCQELDMMLLQRHVPLDVLELIAEDLGQIAVTRALRLNAIVQDLRQSADQTGDTE